MKIVYIAHQISGDVSGNLEKIRQIVRGINLYSPEILPFAPYWLDCHALDDTDPVQRNRGIKNNREFFERKTIDELWIYGNVLSSGIKEEIKLARQNSIPIFLKNSDLEESYFEFLKKLGIPNKPITCINLSSMTMIDKYISENREFELDDQNYISSDQQNRIWCLLTIDLQKILSYVSENSEVELVFKPKEHKVCISHQSFGTYDYYPKNQRLLIRKTNVWLTGEQLLIDLLNENITNLKDLNLTYEKNSI